VKIVRFILRLYSSAYHILLGLFLTGLGVFALATQTASMRLDMLPWFKGPWLHAWLLAIGLIGVASGALALLGRCRIALAIWSTLVLIGMVYGYFINKGYSFPHPTQAHTAFWLTGGALLAAVCAWLTWERPRRA
jgi:hypothetical protein